MANVVVLASDERVKRQVEQYLREMNDDDLAVVIYSSKEEFEKLYFSEQPLEPPPPEPGKEPVFVRFNKITLLIADADVLGQNATDWFAKTLRQTKRFRYWSEGTRTRMVLLKYEEDSKAKLHHMIPEIDDLIYLPLDRLLFMQKMEILLNLPEKVKPSYLFYQPFEETIEISRIVRVDRLNDVGLAIQSPTPLKRGLAAKFYLTLPGGKDQIRFFAKVIRSEPHPEYPGQYLAYFSYFGMRRNETSEIRQMLSKGVKFHPFISDQRDDFRFSEDNLFTTDKEKKVRTIAVLDPDEDQARELASLFKQEIDRCTTIEESSYTLFIHKHLKAQVKTEEEMANPTGNSDLGAENIHFVVQTESKSILKTSASFSAGDLFLGYPAGELFGVGSDRWWGPFKGDENNLIFEESTTLIRENKQRRRLMIGKNAEGAQFALLVQFSPGENSNEMTVEITPAPAELLREKGGKRSQLQSLDLLVIDAAFIPSEFEGWIEFLKNAALDRGLLKNPEDLQLILMTEREDRLDPHWLKSPYVRGFLIKPVDNRALLFLASESLATKYTIYHFENLGWNHPRISAHMSKETICEAASEFGATIRDHLPFKPGSFFFLRKSIFDNAPNGCLAARVYLSEEGAEKGEYLSNVTFFGINDAFLKFVRSWIREVYAESKESTG